jgi:hypothetical protein
LSTIAQNQRIIANRRSRRAVRHDRAAGGDDLTLELAVLGRVGCPEPIADKGDGRNSGGKRTAMGGGVDAERERLPPPAAACGYR